MPGFCVRIGSIGKALLRDGYAALPVRTIGCALRGYAHTERDELVVNLNVAKFQTSLLRESCAHHVNVSCQSCFVKMWSLTLVGLRVLSRTHE